MEKPVSVLPAPAPTIVTSPKRSVENVSAVVAPISPAKGLSDGIISGFTFAVILPFDFTLIIGYFIQV